jgi:TRAP-type C4-dicarboxylate transport system substrate-binding protein
MQRIAQAILVAAALTLTGGVASAVELKLSHPYTDNDTRDIWAKKFGEMLAAKTGNQVTVKIYPNQQLFKARQQYDGLRSNQIDLAIYPMPWLSGKVPASNIGLLPGLVGKPADGLLWRERKIWPMLEAEVEKANVRMAGILWSPATYAAKGKFPAMPSDFKGVKARGMGAPLEAVLAQNGAAITSFPAAEAYSALQTGAVEVLFSTVSSFSGYRLYEVVNHYVGGEESFVAGGHYVLMSEGGWKKLSPDQQKAFTAAMIESEKVFVDLSRKEVADVTKEFADKGVKIETLTPAQLAAWKADSRKHAWSYFVEKTKNGKELLAAVDQPR